jgi:hypothetical protein
LPLERPEEPLGGYNQYSTQGYLLAVCVGFDITENLRLFLPAIFFLDYELI